MCFFVPSILRQENKKYFTDLFLAFLKQVLTVLTTDKSSSQIPILAVMLPPTCVHHPFVIIIFSQVLGLYERLQLRIDKNVKM